jgi:hypothetical protein
LENQFPSAPVSRQAWVSWWARVCRWCLWNARHDARLSKQHWLLKSEGHALHALRRAHQAWKTIWRPDSTPRPTPTPEQVRLVSEE